LTAIKPQTFRDLSQPYADKNICGTAENRRVSVKGVLLAEKNVAAASKKSAIYIHVMQ